MKKIAVCSLLLVFTALLSAQENGFDIDFEDAFFARRR